MCNSVRAVFVCVLFTTIVAIRLPLKASKMNLTCEFWFSTATSVLVLVWNVNLAKRKVFQKLVHLESLKSQNKTRVSELCLLLEKVPAKKRRILRIIVPMKAVKLSERSHCSAPTEEQTVLGMEFLHAELGEDSCSEQCVACPKRI